MNSEEYLRRLQRHKKKAINALNHNPQRQLKLCPECDGLGMIFRGFILEANFWGFGPCEKCRGRRILTIKDKIVRAKSINKMMDECPANKMMDFLKIG